MKRAMEYVRWQLDNWWTQNHGRDWSIYTGIMKIAHYLWRSWKRGAFLLLVLALLPILFSLIVFLSFFGFICAVPLLCGIVALYFFRNFSFPLRITDFIYPSNCPSESLSAGSQSVEEGVLHSAPIDVQEIGISNGGTLLKSPPEGDAKEVPRRAFDAKTILHLDFELRGNERVEADNREYGNSQKLVCPSEANHESGAGSTSSVTCRPNAVFQVRGPILLLPPAKFKGQYEESWSLDGGTGEFRADALEREVSIVSGHANSKSGEAPTGGLVIFGKRTDAVGANQTHAYSSPDVSSVGINYLVPGTTCTPERRRTSGTDWTSGTGVSYEGSMLDVYGEHPSAEPVVSEHTTIIPRNGGTSGTLEHCRRYAPDGKDCRAGNRMLTGNTEVITGGTPCSNTNLPGTNSTYESTPELSTCIKEERTEAAMKSNSIPFSHSVVTTPEADFKPAIHTVRPKYWRDEVEDMVSSSAFTKAACIENPECARGAEVYSALQTTNYGQYKENMDDGEIGRSGPSLRFASLFTYQRRLSFGNVLADDKLRSPGCSFPRGELSDFTPDYKQRSVSTSFSDYTWSSESSEQGFEFLSTQGAAYEESCAGADSSTEPYEGENKLESGTVLNSPSFPTPDQLTEDWETRRKRWEEESTLGKLVPLSPYMGTHSARSICNPLFEFSTPSPPLKKLRTQDMNDISNLPSPHTRFSKRYSTLSDGPKTHAGSSGYTPSPPPLRLQKRKSGIYTELLDGDVCSLATNTADLTLLH